MEKTSKKDQGRGKYFYNPIAFLYIASVWFVGVSNLIFSKRKGKAKGKGIKPAHPNDEECKQLMAVMETGKDDSHVLDRIVFRLFAYKILGLNHENMDADKHNSALSTCLKQRYGIGFDEYCKLMLDIANAID